MTPDSVLFFILGLIVFNFVFGIVLSVLNLENLKKDIPEELSDVYTPEEWTKARKYQKVNFRFSLISGIISTAITLAFIGLGGFGWLYATIETYVQNPIFLGIVFFGVLGLASDIIGMPFSLYHTFVIEEQFGFNNSTIKIWLLDKLKGYALGTLIGTPLLALLFFLLQELGGNFS
jgi:STE24 endopeptidase